MKNIIIIGQPRCGKTTLANMLYRKYKYQIIHADCERVALDLAFPELNIKNNELFPKYLEILLRKNKRDNRNNFSVILEGTDIKISDIMKYFNLNENIVICLGVCSIDYSEFANEIMNNDTELDWTKKCTNDEILNYCKEYIEKSMADKNECEKYGLRFVDTSINRTKKLRLLVKEIESLI